MAKPQAVPTGLCPFSTGEHRCLRLLGAIINPHSPERSSLSWASCSAGLHALPRSGHKSSLVGPSPPWRSAHHAGRSRRMVISRQIIPTVLRRDNGSPERKISQPGSVSQRFADVTLHLMDNISALTWLSPAFVIRSL